MLEVLPFDFMQGGEQTLRLTPLLTSTFQLMTSCDFGALHFPIQCAMLIRWITPWLQQQKQGRISGTLALKGNQKQKKSEKTVEQSMAIGISLRWYYRGDPNSKISSPESFPQTKAKLSINHSFKIRIQNSRLQICKVEFNFSIKLNNCRSGIWMNLGPLNPNETSTREKLMAQQAAGKPTFYRPSTCEVYVVKNPDPSKVAVLRTLTPAIQVQTPRLEGPIMILRVWRKLLLNCLLSTAGPELAAEIGKWVGVIHWLLDCVVGGLVGWLMDGCIGWWTDGFLMMMMMMMMKNIKITSPPLHFIF